MTTPSTKANLRTEEAWIEWLADAERLLKEEYLRRPKRLISDYRTERGITHGYQGREILEMLQNAGDAAEKAGIRGRIRIELCRHGVLIANTGQGFDAGGVDSLQTANLSPKFLERRKLGTLIGNKGLGFRAILNWTVTPLISSGALRLAYPNFWPETIRALMVHSANWTETMKRQFLPTGDRASKTEYKRLVRLCGWGVPDLDRALNTARNHLTLVSEAEMQPYTLRDGRVVTNDMHLHDLPWPKDVLLHLPPETEVSMRVR